MDKFRQCLAQLSACDTIMVGYHSLTFLLRVGVRVCVFVCLLQLITRAENSRNSAIKLS